MGHVFSILEQKRNKLTAPFLIQRFRLNLPKMKCKGDLREFIVTGRKLPSDAQSSPPLYRVRLFAPDPIAAKSRFWYFVSYYKKVNKTAGEIVSIKKVADRRQELRYLASLRLALRFPQHVPRVPLDAHLRTAITQLHNSAIKFPLPRKIISRKSQNAPRFTTRRPN